MQLSAKKIKKLLACAPIPAKYYHVQPTTHMNITTKQLTVKLSHRSNPDLFDRGGYWDEPTDSGKTQAVKINSFAEASKVCSDFIRRNSLGAGNWTGGKIYEGRNYVGHVSFNGRVWDKDDNEIVVD